MDTDDLAERFEVASCVKWILDRQFSSVALQFPDQLLGHAHYVTAALQTALQVGEDHRVVRLYVCADTTYSSCCVDEVAAAHAPADCVIHFGPACLSPVSRLPVKYVFGRSPLNCDHLAQRIAQFQAELASSSPPPPAVLVIFDLEFVHARSELIHRLGVNHPHPKLVPLVVVADVASTERNPSSPTSPPGPASANPSPGARTSGAASATPERDGLGGLEWRLPPGVETEQCAVVWVGADGPGLTNLLMRAPLASCSQFLPEKELWVAEVASRSQALKRRYFLVQKAKEANIVGVLVGTLGVAGYRAAIDRLRGMAQAAGKKCYTFSMGRVTPAKLANFPEVDVFVLVACAQTALVESKDFYAPVITPFEAELAFASNREWPGFVRMDFDTLLQDSAPPDRPPPSVSPPETGPRFSLVTGRLTAAADSGESDELTASDPTSESAATQLALQAQRALAVREQAGVTAAEEVHSGAEFLMLRRSYVGMAAAASDKTTAEAPQAFLGQSGRAAGYHHEKDASQT
mmetsp:Transcript_47112/g.87846  ORF Transcript_47112/g.87846 Transcript_47112/m.87846 type:complete len:521 (-) Transcript_47112:251-1813(-)|eukprot:CAMPEP_0114276812 /NCGR_PEP_ID=MMETSP0059-20121206/438_1 /TAXON_ID=36894 /ORGANISM="Pyramimonas parkeae, Strain CCMP726" /LENGTH=520 /DNA_ID=CAMNT_0001396839 /DNA_START=417 /DNA_END=1979 /DNA_ORIENTATION=-